MNCLNCNNLFPQINSINSGWVTRCKFCPASLINSIWYYQNKLSFAAVTFPELPDILFNYNYEVNELFIFTHLNKMPYSKKINDSDFNKNYLFNIYKTIIL